MNAGIYKITIGPWFYWGQTNDFNRREKQHLSQLEDNRHRNIILRNAYKKYKVFEFEIISIVEDPDERTEFEQLILDVWCGTENCANINPQAMVPPSNKGKPQSDAHRAALSAAHKGKTLSDEHRAKMSDAKKGKPRSEETRTKISAARRAYWEKRKRANSISTVGPQGG